MTLSVNPFATLAKNFKAIATASPILLNLNQDHPAKKGLSGQILVKFKLITSLIEVLELPNLGHIYNINGVM